MTNEPDKANMSRLIVDLLGRGNLNVVDELAIPDFIEQSGPHAPACRTLIVAMLPMSGKNSLPTACPSDID